jgi:hypothetical protein
MINKIARKEVIPMLRTGTCVYYDYEDGLSYGICAMLQPGMILAGQAGGIKLTYTQKGFEEKVLSRYTGWCWVETGGEG